ncbi:phospholipase D family protein [Pseudomonas aeruginosa]|uniref:VPA1262 family N-terminal domain-containing protein n=1 Tax=Pseudomonas TaxID=286 RepID=UPI00040CED4D|nr:MULTISPECIES: VPA1262 family N-terminal domain-containing protein [Pseudomonas]HCL2794206.1 hypothetical protein [Pseudomonas aeruginosa 7D9A]EIU7148982.1 hypothetical protein [Pseudomonas aeruginosa]ELQ7312831.1 hypothetical protein [Pseudomonas aeruginosa]ELQ7320036.1 hypothetical protein [Pseudomonas aeruginosa]ELQ7332033.1 hypothetical protein [Pseudomonas aeruginosa]
MESLEQSLSHPHNKALAGFDYAVVHIAVLVPPTLSSEKPPLRLLFASVWLLAPGRQIPSRPPKPFIKRMKKEGTIAVDRIVMRADEAVQWYRTSSNEFTTPSPYQESRDGCDGIPLDTEYLSDFPRWPLLGVPMESEDMTNKSERSSIPFRNLGIIRYSRRISKSQAWPDVLDPSGRTKNCEEVFRFIERHMHIDFREYPEYLGGMTLAVPDRDVHSVKQFIEPKEDGSESLYFHVKPHQGQALQDLSLTAFEGQEGMLTSFETFKVPEDGLVEINRPSTIDTAGLILTHEERGVLMQAPMRSFMRQMNLTTEVVERRVKISAPEREGKKSPQNEYFTEKKTLASAQTYGDPVDHTDAYKRLIDAKAERYLNHSARIYDQTWFITGQRKEALDHIRQKLKNSRATVFIADPYFSANQITQYLFAIERDDIQIRVLTSVNAFKKTKVPPTDSEPSAPVPDTRQALLHSIDTFRSTHKNSLDIRVATTENSLFHDRFIAIDGRVWMLGSSLNSIGIRPTLVMRIPHGEKILDHLLDLFDQAISLEEFSGQQGEIDA